MKTNCFCLKNDIKELGTRYLRHGPDIYAKDFEAKRIAKKLKNCDKSNLIECMDFLANIIGEFTFQHKLLKDIINLVNKNLPEEHRLTRETAPSRSISRSIYYFFFQESIDKNNIQSFKQELLAHIQVGTLGR